MYNGLQLSDGKRTLFLTLHGYDMEFREHQKKGPTWRRFNSVKYSFDIGHWHANDRHLSTFDIERITVAAEAVLLGRVEKASVSSRRKDFKLTLTKTPPTYKLSIELTVDSGKVTVCRNIRDKHLFSRYCTDFYRWKLLYPVLSEHELRRVYTTRPGKSASTEEIRKRFNSLEDMLRLSPSPDDEYWDEIDLGGALEDFLFEDDDDIVEDILYGDDEGV